MERISSRIVDISDTPLPIRPPPNCKDRNDAKGMEAKQSGKSTVERAYFRQSQSFILYSIIYRYSLLGRDCRCMSLGCTTKGDGLDISGRLAQTSPGGD